MYSLPIDRNIYSKMNKDRSINKYFSSKSVGKCIKLIDDYYHSTNMFSKVGWENYYLTKEREIRLFDIIDIIRPKISYATYQDVMDYVYFRVVGQTYNGYLTELNVINELKKIFPNLVFEKSTFELDEQFFTDFECFTDNELVFAGQIKPVSYKKMNTPYQVQAKENHRVQRQAYMDKFKVPHFMFYYDNGELTDKEELTNQINTILYLKAIL